MADWNEVSYNEDMKILIADDTEQIVKVLCAYAQKEGYEPTAAYDGQEALDYFEKIKFDMILLDVMMPKVDGFEVCKQIRKSSNVPIIMVTARGEDFDKIMGLDIGADDYIVKPFSPQEVMARIRCILRRANPASAVEKKLTAKNLSLDLDGGTVFIGDKNIPVTKKELEMLELFLQNQNQVFSREQLLNNIWGMDYDGDARAVDQHIKRLRAKLDAVERNGWKISTVFGAGYKFES